MMDAILRKLRGAVGTAVTWAIGWAVVAFLVFSVIRLVGVGSAPFAEFVGVLTAITAASGFVAGGIFSLGLATFHRDRRLEDLRVGPMAGLGAVAAVLLPGLAAVSGLFEYTPLTLRGTLVLGTAIAVLGGVTGGGLVKIAKGADADRLPPVE